MKTCLGRYFRACMLLSIGSLAIALIAAAAYSKEENAEKSSNAKVPIGRWLMLGPLTSPFPAFNEEGKAKIEASDLLAYEHLRWEKLKPIAGARVDLIGGDHADWREIAADTLGVLIPENGELPNIAYLATYVEVPRWTEIDIESRSSGLFELRIDGSSILTQKKIGKMDASDDKQTGSAKLQKGKHLLIVKAVYVPSDTLADWRLDVRVSVKKDIYSNPQMSLEPLRAMNIGDILDVPVMNNVDLSPVGKYFALTMSKRNPPEGESERWLEIRRFEDGKLLRTLKDMSGASNWQWSPTGNRLSYSVVEKEKGTVRVLDMDIGEVESIIEDVKDFSGYEWSPDGTFIVYSIRNRAEKDESGVKRLRGISDRRRHERDRTYLYLSSVPSGITRRLTAGEHSTQVYDVHPDSRSALIRRSYEYLSERPYSMTELVLLNLEDQSTETLWKGHWLRGAKWSPDGKKILITAGPSTFGKTGQNVPEGTIANDYDAQAYIYDPKSKTAEPMTKDFDPTVLSVYWPKPGTDIYLVVEEGEYVRLYKYNVKNKVFKNIELGFDIVHRRDVARDKPVAVVTGSSADHPWRLYSIDLKNGRVRMLLDPCTERFANVELGKVEDWNFKTSSGREIVGRIHYPPDFNASKKWPCIVYYYGGTSPVSRSFGGRYPKNLWAAMGYVVYVLQPGGATGFGQEFSALHVNDWGKIVADEIIEGTKKFLEAHTFIDPERIGCIGASFGGFMTQLLITKTNMFSAAVSHAGISSISSYWGEGYWGYGYSSVATANSFPWNRPDIYVDQSPLFSADKINTPLLLLHGASDTNVPPGESDQMYAALKLLEKEVEYIRFAEQNHFILDYKKRIAWSDAILAWFDRWLKDEPEWWNDMYPPIIEDKTEELEEIGVYRFELEKYGVVLLGEVSRQDIEEHLDDWFADYFDYSPDGETLSELAKYIDDVKITCVLGTWCGDSKREVPRLYKILDELGYPVSEVELFAVGGSRFTREMSIPPKFLEWSNTIKAWYDVKAVATIILLRNGEEIGRIIEAPDQTLEKDLLKIVKK
ncbi:MAG: prolyl oligopeptidase family serine peptidase [Candidatus Latescibacteria bacterium]|nr:prolyl oligopeptidase family serine peptidase [Candidatus Latescibacterota bacterium]NIO56175.1 prolyl oligopeptidase family serine peptidase [Candidatus Latescibacterota bacterium]